MWDKLSTANKVMIVAVIVVTVLAVAGVVVGIATHEDRDAGLLSVCWSGSSAVYDSTDCAEPQDLTWERSRIPLIVGAPEDGSLDSAIDLVNSQIGCEVLRHDSTVGSEADVIVDLDAAILVGRDVAGGATTHSRDSEGRMHAMVEILAVGDAHMKMRVLAHEFGHVLGLAHDDFRTSIMYPTQTYSHDLQFTMFTQGDQSRLRTLYCD